MPTTNDSRFASDEQLQQTFEAETVTGENHHRGNKLPIRQTVAPVSPRDAERLGCADAGCRANTSRS